MERLVPSLQAAEAFLAVAQAPSLRLAARELALSPSALSRRIQSLEDFVGAPLFTRAPSGLVMTDLGQRYFNEIAPAIETLRQATLSLRSGQSTLRVAASHTFTTEWLLPRLPALNRSHGLTVQLVVGDPLRALHNGRADIAIKGGPRPFEDLHCEALGEAEAVLVASPGLSDEFAQPVRLLDAHPRLVAPDNAEIWRQWLGAMGRADLQRVQSRRCDTLQMTYEAAANGFGVTLAFPMVAERFFKAKRIAPCPNTRRTIDGRYWILQNRCAKRTAAGRGELQTLLAWLDAEADASFRHFAALTSR